VSDSESALDFLRKLDPSRSFVIAQLGQSLDGRIALPSGESKYINGSAALDHLHNLRACVDAVVVGVNTVLQDDPLLNVRRAPGRSPARVIIDPHGRLTTPYRCFASADAPVYVVRSSDCCSACPPPAQQIAVNPSGRNIPTRAIIDALAENGLRRLLIEGGANTLSRFFVERQLDRLHLLLGPVFLGEGLQGLSFPSPVNLRDAVRTKPVVYALEGGDVLIDCPLQRDV
jgi:riboflavin-specific deaminase-like protein